MVNRQYPLCMAYLGDNKYKCTQDKFPPITVLSKNLPIRCSMCPLSKMLEEQKHQEEYELPKLTQLAKNFGVAVTKHVIDGLKRVSESEYNERINICNNCVRFKNGRCRHKNCGCFISKKAWWASEDCPDKKWPNLTYDLVVEEENIQNISLKPLIVILGIHRTLSSALAMALENLGIDFGDDVNRGEEQNLARILEDLMPFPTIVKNNSIELLYNWIDDYMKRPSSFLGVKYPTLSAYMNEVYQHWPNLKIIHINRPLEESIQSLITRSNKNKKKFSEEQCREVQIFLRDEIKKFLVDKSFIVVEADDLMSDPRTELQKIAKYIGMEPSEQDLKKAINVIKPQLAPHSSIVEKRHTANWEDVTTICIKTFERPMVLNNCLRSIRKKYQKVPILIADDSSQKYDLICDNNTTLIPLEYDSGLSIGRNILMQNVQTPYVLYLDDDSIFTELTDISKMFNILRIYDFDLVAGQSLRKGKMNGFECSFEIRNNILYMIYGSNRTWNFYPRYDLTKNFWMAKTNTVQNIKWEDRLKVGEHIDWFLKAWLKDIKITFFDKVIVMDSSPKPSDEYSKMRARAKQWHEESMAEWGKRLGVDKIIRQNSFDTESVIIDVKNYNTNGDFQ